MPLRVMNVSVDSVGPCRPLTVDLLTQGAEESPKSSARTLPDGGIIGYSLSLSRMNLVFSTVSLVPITSGRILQSAGSPIGSRHRSLLPSRIRPWTRPSDLSPEASSFLLA
jgi:hypothetical protein